MPEDLRVDTGLVRDAGGRLQTIAADLPEPPAVHRPTGVDALSAAIAAKVTEVVDPVVAQMPIAKQALKQYAQKVVSAADKYDATDRQMAEEILKRVDEFDKRFGGENSAGSGGASASVTAPSGPSTAPAASGGQVAAAAAGQQGRDFGSMMQMPMQMAQQAAQAPMQMAGMAGAAPQALQQGAQQAVEQIGQLSEAAGEGAPKPEVSGPSEADAGTDAGDRAPETLTPAPSKTAARGNSGPEILL